MGRQSSGGRGRPARAVLVLALLGAPIAAGGADADAEGAVAPLWTQPFAEVGTVQIVTLDEDGDVRQKPVWIVTSGEDAWVRTNDSRWLANIRRGSPIDLQTDTVLQMVAAVEVDDAAEAARVEELYKAKYGWIQRVMSTLRISEPTVLRLRPATRSLPVGARE